MIERKKRSRGPTPGLVAAVAVTLLGAPSALEAQEKSARARVSVTVVQGAVAAADSAMRQGLRRFLRPDRAAATPASRRWRVAGEPAGLIRVRVRADSVENRVYLDLEYVGTD